MEFKKNLHAIEKQVKISRELVKIFLPLIALIKL